MTKLKYNLIYFKNNLIFMITFLNPIYFYHTKIISLCLFIKLAQNFAKNRKKEVRIFKILNYKIKICKLCSYYKTLANLFGS